MTMTKLVWNDATQSSDVVPMSQAEIDQWNADQAAAQAAKDAQATADQAIADARASGIAHALSLNFTQAQAEAMFP